MVMVQLQCNNDMLLCRMHEQQLGRVRQGRAGSCGLEFCLHVVGLGLCASGGVHKNNSDNYVIMDCREMGFDFTSE